LPDFARVSIKMAKDQDLPLTPSKISGVCGRLLCCLSYEHEQYLEIKAELPERGDWVQTPHGPGEVVAVNVVKENVAVDLGDGNTVECTAQQILDVRRRVAAEAQGRNAEGITPAAQQYGLAHIAADELLAGDDPHVLHALEDLDELPPHHDRAQPKPIGAGPKPMRPDAALGASLSQSLRPTPPRAPSPQVQSSAPQRSEQHAKPPTMPPAQLETTQDMSASELGELQAGGRRRKRRKRNGKG
jgi:hypothetical protein